MDPFSVFLKAGSDIISISNTDSPSLSIFMLASQTLSSLIIMSKI